MNKSNTIVQVWHHPIVKGIVGVVVFVAVAEAMIFFILPAWAIEVPVTNRIVIDLGAAAQLVTALVAAAGLWRAWRAEKKAAEAAAAAKAISIQIDGLLTERDKAKIREGRAEEKLTAEATAATLARGQEQGRASVQAPAAATAAAATPLPVADDRTAGAAERSAAALERVATTREEKKS